MYEYHDHRRPSVELAYEGLRCSKPHSRRWTRKFDLVNMGNIHRTRYPVVVNHVYVIHVLRVTTYVLVLAIFVVGDKQHPIPPQSSGVAGLVNPNLLEVIAQLAPVSDRYPTDEYVRVIVSVHIGVEDVKRTELGFYVEQIKRLIRRHKVAECRGITFVIIVAVTDKRQVKQRIVVIVNISDEIPYCDRVFDAKTELVEDIFSRHRQYAAASDLPMPIRCRQHDVIPAPVGVSGKNALENGRNNGEVANPVHILLPEM